MLGLILFFFIPFEPHDSVFFLITLLGMDPPKEMMVSDVTEDAVTISWIKPLAPFEYYKLSYQSARGSVHITANRDVILKCIWITRYLLY